VAKLAWVEVPGLMSYVLAVAFMVATGLYWR